MHVLIVDSNRVRQAAWQDYLRCLRPGWQIDVADNLPQDHHLYDAILGANNQPENSDSASSIDIRYLSGRAVLKMLDDIGELRGASALWHRALPGYANLGRLSSREREMLPFLREGASNKEIAQALGLQVATIKLHVRGLCKKMGVKNRMQAGLLAQRLILH